MIDKVNVFQGQRGATGPTGEPGIPGEPVSFFTLRWCDTDQLATPKIDARSISPTTTFSATFCSAARCKFFSDFKKLATQDEEYSANRCV